MGNYKKLIKLLKSLFFNSVLFSPSLLICFIFPR